MAPISKAAINSALSDVEETTDNISSALSTFAELCLNDDGQKAVLQAESRALSHLHSKYFEVSSR